MLRVNLELKKYAKTISIKKTKGFHEIEQHKDYLKKNHIDYKIKDELDLQAVLLYYRGLLNRDYLYEDYFYSTNENRELWSLMSYQQRQVLLEGQLKQRLDQIPYYQKEDQLILMPFYDEMVNDLYIHDFQRVLLEKNHPSSSLTFAFQDPLSLYGYEILFQGFCDFIKIKELDENCYLYLEEFKTIYIYNNQNHSFVEKICICDKYSDVSFTLENLVQIVTYYHEKKELELLDYLFEINSIQAKTYKKIKKKL